MARKCYARVSACCSNMESKFTDLKQKLSQLVFVSH